MRCAAPAPITKAGRAISSRNALKHGLTADALVEKVLPLLRKKTQLKPSVA